MSILHIGIGDSAGTPLIQAGAAAGVVPPRAGVSTAVAQQSCLNANGTWDSANNGCRLPSFPTLPGYCSWVPFATAMFSDCALPNATDLQNIGAYTAYQAGMIQNDPTVTTGLMQDNLTQSNQLISQQDCSYTAAQNSPVLSQIFGPTLTCALTDPTSPSFWLLYAVVGIGAFVLLRGR